MPVEAVVPAEAAAFEEERAPKACAVPTGRCSVQLPLLEPVGPLMAPPGDREGAHGGVGGAARGIAASVRRPRAAREGSQPPDQRTTCVTRSTRVLRASLSSTRGSFFPQRRVNTEPDS